MKRLGWIPHVDVLDAYHPFLVPRHDPFLVEAVLQLQSEGAFDHDLGYHEHYKRLRVVELQSDRYALAAYDGEEYLIEPHMMVSWRDHPLPEEYIQYTQNLTGWGTGIRDTLARFLRFLDGEGSDQYCLFENGIRVTLIFQPQDFIRVTDDIGMIHYSHGSAKCMWRKRDTELLPPCG